MTRFLRQISPTWRPVTMSVFKDLGHFNSPLIVKVQTKVHCLISMN